MGHLVKKLKHLFLNGIPNEPYKMVLVVRTDITMGRGKTAAQCAHAAIACYNNCLNNKINQEYLDTWLTFGQPKIVLKISSEEKLRQLEINARHEGLTTAIIRDAGRTQLDAGTVSVLGVGPGPNSIVDKVTSHLQLL